MENVLTATVKKAYFLVVATLMYYFMNEYLDLGMHVTYRHAFALVLFVSALVLFLYKPNFGRGFTAFGDACMYSTPLLVTTLASLFIWFVGMVDVSVISRGLNTAFIYTNMLSAALAAGAMLYVFGEKGVWYNLLAILAANLIIIFTIIAQYGLAGFLSEFVTLIVTFADVTGDIIIHAEVHELAFCLGAYLIFMLFKPQKKATYWILLSLTVFCFLAAFKRIAMIAIAVALVIGYLLKLLSKWNDKSAHRVATVLSVVVMLILIGYVGLIKLDIFTLLEEAGINTSGRVEVYHAVDKFYEFSPEFLGNGIGFLTYQLNTNMTVGVASVHNDFLQYFIDLGFWGYLLWLFAMTVMRVRYFGRNGNTENAILTLMLTMYLVIVSSTDNTMNYPLLTSTLALLMMGNGFDSATRRREMKLLGYITRENRASKKDGLL